MKKIYLSLILTLLFFLINPSLFINKDAKYTYENKEARIDVVAETLGYSNINVKNWSYRTPEWFNKNNNQGVVIECPVNYLNKNYFIEIEPIFKTKKAKIRIEFKANQVVHNGKNKKALVNYKNIFINDYNFKNNIKVWHDDFVVYEIEQTKPEKIKINFDVKKTFSVYDIKWIHFFKIFVGIYVVIFLSNLFISRYSKFKFEIKRYVILISNYNLIDYLWKKYNYIDVVLRRSFWTIFIILNVVFGFHTINFMHGNHDWNIYDKIPVLSSMFNGRYSLFVLSNIFFDGNVIPVITNVIGFLVLSLSSILTLSYWQLTKKTAYYVICGLLLTLQGFSLEWLYYYEYNLEQYFNILFVNISFIISEKALTCCKTKKIVFHVFIALILHYCISAYPPSINTIAIILIGKIFIDCLNKNGLTIKTLNDIIIKRHLLYLIDFFVAAVSYKIVFLYLLKIGRISQSYMTENLLLNQAPQRLYEIIKVSFERLVFYSAPFMPNSITIAFFVLLILLIGQICFQNRKKIEKVELIFILFLGLISSNCSSLISGRNTAFINRISFFGFVYFRILIVVALLKYFENFKMVKQLLFMFIIYVSVLNDGIALRTWKAGFESEKMMWNRMLARLEIQSDFNPQKKYFIIQIGGYRDTRLKYFDNNKTFDVVDEGTIGHTYDPRWRPFTAQEFYYPVNFIKERLSSSYHMNDTNFKNVLKKLYENGILQKSKSWPDKYSLIVFEDVILLNYDEKKLKQIINDIKKGII